MIDKPYSTDPLQLVLYADFLFLGFTMTDQVRVTKPKISVEDCPDGYYCIEVFKAPWKPDEWTCVAYGPTLEKALEELKTAVDGGVLYKIGNKYEEPKPL